ncbi:MAG: iron-sulfur cluster assembly accessory protein [Myxococcales bacterium]|nr:iron-sulfur cluster assembly accessory protein [Myxococcales bacterium]
MAVTLTPAAADRIRRYLAETPGGLGLRFGVRKSGCTGFAYVVDIATEAGADDHVFETAGVAVRVDPASLPQVDGTEIDFVEGLHGSGFKFNNPNVTSTCGCGQSFSV